MTEGIGRPPVRRVSQVRSEYTSARLILANLEHRTAGTQYTRQAGYLPPAVDYTTEHKRTHTIAVRDYDVRFLDRVAPEMARAHLDLILRARLGNQAARDRLRDITRRLHPRIAARFQGTNLVETEHIIPYTSDREFSEEQISHKGGTLLDLTRRGFATPISTSWRRGSRCSAAQRGPAVSAVRSAIWKH